MASSSFGPFIQGSGGGGSSTLTVPPGIPEVVLGYVSGQSATSNADHLMTLGNTNCLIDAWQDRANRLNYSDVFGWERFPGSTQMDTQEDLPSATLWALDSAFAFDDGTYNAFCAQGGTQIALYDSSLTSTTPDVTLTPGTSNLSSYGSQSGDYLVCASTSSTDDLSVFKRTTGTWATSPVDYVTPSHTTVGSRPILGNNGDTLIISYPGLATGGDTNVGKVELRTRSGDTYNVVSELVPPLLGQDTFHEALAFDGTALVTWVRTDDEGDLFTDNRQRAYIWTDKGSNTWTVDTEIDLRNTTIKVTIAGSNIFILDSTFRVNAGAGAVLHYKKEDAGTSWGLLRILTPSPYAMPTNSSSSYALKNSVLCYNEVTSTITCMANFSSLSGNSRFVTWDI